MNMRISFLHFTWLCVFCISCNTEGHLGVSKNIADSKNRKTYLYSFAVFTSNTKADEYLLPEIKEVFLEKSWFVGKPKSTYDSKFLTLVIIINNDLNFNKCSIGDFTFTYKNTLVLRMDKTILTDTLKFPCYMLDDGEKLADVYMVAKH